MIENIDAYIVNRLRLIKINGNPIKVFEYASIKDRGEFQFPCMSVSRLEVVGNPLDKRFGIEVFEPSTEKQVVQIWDGTYHIIPKEYTARPFPTPVDVRYLVDAYSTNKEQHDAITELYLQAFYPGFQPHVEDQWPLFLNGKPVSRDALYIPVFRTTYILVVTNLWLKRLENYTTKPMSSVIFDVPSENTIDYI